MRKAVAILFVVASAGRPARAASGRPYDDVRLEPRRGLTAGRGAPQVVYLDFDGANVMPATADDATQGLSLILQQNMVTGGVTIPPFDATPYGLSQGQAVAQIVSAVQAQFAAYQVTFTTTRPSAGPYTTAIIGGAPGDINETMAGVAGVALLDCGNANPSNIVFILATTLGSLQDVTTDVCHELGHSFGEAHDDTNTSDIMYPRINGMALGFLVGEATEMPASASRCTLDASFQSAAGVLLDNLGPSMGVPDLGAPVVNVSFPPAAPQPPGTISVYAEAFDDTGVTRVELQRDRTSLGSLSLPPFAFADTSVPAGMHTYDVIAYDTAGNQTDVSLPVAVSAGAPSPSAQCQTSADCPSDQVCTQGSCVTPADGMYRAVCDRNYNCMTNACDLSSGLQGVCTGACRQNTDCASGLCLASVCAEANPGNLVGGCASAGPGAGDRGFGAWVLISVAIGVVGLTLARRARRSHSLRLVAYSRAPQSEESRVRSDSNR